MPTNNATSGIGYNLGSHVILFVADNDVAKREVESGKQLADSVFDKGVIHIGKENTVTR